MYINIVLFVCSKTFKLDITFASTQYIHILEIKRRRNILNFWPIQITPNDTYTKLTGSNVALGFEK